MIELLVVFAIIAVLAGLLLPALAKAKSKARGVGCLNNVKQLSLGWFLYTDDNQDHLVNNHGIEETRARRQNWVNHVQDWTDSEENTNLVYLSEAKLAPHLSRGVAVFNCPADPSRTLYTSNTAARRGKPALTVESGSLGLTDDASVGRLVAGALSLMAHLGMADAPSVRVERPLWIDRGQVVTAPATGVWHPVVDQKESVATGTLLGRISDAFGTVTHEVRAPFAGELLYVVRASSAVAATRPFGMGIPCLAKIAFD